MRGHAELSVLTLMYASDLAAPRFGQPMIVDRDAHRDGRVQIDSQDLGYRAELLFGLGVQPYGVPEATSLIKIGLLLWLA